MVDENESIVIDWANRTVGISRDTDDSTVTISNEYTGVEGILFQILQQVPEFSIENFEGRSFVIIQNFNEQNNDERQGLAKHVFDIFRAGFLYFANSAHMSLYAYGETSGLNVHLSSDAAFITPVYSSYAVKIGYIKCSLDELASNIEASIKKIDVGLRGKLLSKIFISGDSANSDLAAEIVEKLKPVFEGYEVNVTAPGLKNPHIIGAINFSLTQQFYSMGYSYQDYDVTGPFSNSLLF